MDIKHKIIIEVAETGQISVRLIGPHMLKRTTLQVIKAFKLKYKETIILYRAHKLANRVKTEDKNKEKQEEIIEKE